MEFNNNGNSTIPSTKYLFLMVKVNFNYKIAISYHSEEYKVNIKVPPAVKFTFQSFYVYTNIYG